MLLVRDYKHRKALLRDVITSIVVRCQYTLYLYNYSKMQLPDIIIYNEVKCNIFDMLACKSQLNEACGAGI